MSKLHTIVFMLHYKKFITYTQYQSMPKSSPKITEGRYLPYHENLFLLQTEQSGVENY